MALKENAKKDTVLVVSLNKYQHLHLLSKLPKITNNTNLHPKPACRGKKKKKQTKKIIMR